MKYYALKNKKTGELFTTITGTVLVATHPLKEKGYKTVELEIKGGTEFFGYHRTCQKRIKKEGVGADCCDCMKHRGCEFKNKK